ncbi:uncharacterized protein [Macrobrachium rosenbergii]|uniref:uncharacterized protein isoform X2 n=1 Tax=Macrobrachium rosenbergii TaxID=79674 RepID=UPI0034D79CF8
MLRVLVLITTTAISQGLPTAEHGDPAPGILLKQGGYGALDNFMKTVTDNLKKRITDAADIPGIRQKSTCGGRACALDFGLIKLKGLSTIYMTGTASQGAFTDFISIWIIGMINGITAESRGTLTIKGKKGKRKVPVTLKAVVKQVDIDASTSIDHKSCTATYTSLYLTVYETNITFSRTNYDVILGTAPLIEEKIKNYIQNYTSTLQSLLGDVMRTTPMPNDVKLELHCYGTSGRFGKGKRSLSHSSGQQQRSNDQSEE